MESCAGAAAPAEDRNIGEFTAYARRIYDRAVAGDPGAQFDLSELYRTSLCVPRSPHNARYAEEWMAAAARQDYPAAILLCHHYGYAGYAKGAHTAGCTFKSAAAQGCVHAMYLYGRYRVYTRADDAMLAEGLALLEAAVASGHPAAKLALGIECLDGKVMPRDTDRGVQLIREAAEAGLPEAEYHLSGLYAPGEVLPENRDLRVQWLQRAASAGLGEAICGLGSDADSRKDYRAAEEFFLRAAEHGHTPALYALANMRLFSSLYHPAGLDYKGYLYWLEQGARRGDGDGTPVGAAEAPGSSAHGQPPAAAARAAKVYFKGEGVPIDERRGAQVLQAAVDAQCDSFSAYEMLATCYREGRGVPKDPKRMAALYERWAGVNMTFAFELARCYELGDGVDMDLRRAAALYARCAERGHAEGTCCSAGWGDEG